MAVMPSPPAEPPSSSPPDPKPFKVSLRNLVIIVLAIVTGIIADELLRRSGMPPGSAAVAAAGAFGGVFYFLDRIVE